MGFMNKGGKKDILGVRRDIIENKLIDYNDLEKFDYFGYVNDILSKVNGRYSISDNISVDVIRGSGEVDELVSGPIVINPIDSGPPRGLELNGMEAYNLYQILKIIFEGGWLKWS